MTTPRILLVEDNPVTSQTLVLFLSAEHYEVQCAFKGHDGIQLFQREKFNLVILDLMLPDLDGLKICTQMRAKSTTPIIILTAKTTEDEIVEGLEAGADDYVCKPFGSKELLARVRRCLRQSRHVPPSFPNEHVVKVGQLEVQLSRREVRIGGKPVKLTKSEFEILSVLAQQPGRVFTRAQLIDKALGHDFDGFDRTIDTHIWSLRKKLGEPRGNPNYILSELGIGYRLQDEFTS